MKNKNETKKTKQKKVTKEKNIFFFQQKKENYFYFVLYRTEFYERLLNFGYAMWNEGLQFLSTFLEN